MKIYVKYDNELCELWNYSNTKSNVTIKSLSKGMLQVPKREIEVLGFRNGKGDSGELRIL